MQFEEEVIEILNTWLKDCKIQFYFRPIECVYRLFVYFHKYNIEYTVDIPYNKELDAKKVTHRLLSDITSHIIKHFMKG